MFQIKSFLLDCTSGPGFGEYYTPTLNNGYYYEPAQTKLNLDQFIEYIDKVDNREYLPK